MNQNKTNHYKFTTLLILSFCFTNICGQSFNDDKISMTDYIKRMHNSIPFEGVKIIDDYDHQYLVSVISLDKSKYNNFSIMNRVAQVKAQSQVSTFINGASISMDMIISTKETKDSSKKIKTIVESVEQIKQNSSGFSQGLELLTNFDNADGKRGVFVFMREIIK